MRKVPEDHMGSDGCDVSQVLHMGPMAGATLNHHDLMRNAGFVAKLKELRASDAAEIQQLKADVEALVGALHLAQLENQQLRETGRPDGTTIRMLPTPAPPPQRRE